MSGVTVRDVYYCGNDCEWGSHCPGHAVSLEFRGSSETYEFQMDAHNRVWFTKPELEVLIRMVITIGAQHACAYRPEVP